MMNNFNNLQHEVHLFISQVGGYWKPEFASLRLIEEFSEMVESYENKSSEKEKELADLLIISICIANQYTLTIQAQSQSKKIDKLSFSSILNKIGNISRIINFYEGPKEPKKNEIIPSLSANLSGLINHIVNFCSHHNIDIAKEIKEKITISKKRDFQRFKDQYDPTLCYNSFLLKPFLLRSSCPFSHTARLWFSEDYSNITSLVTILTSFKRLLMRFTKISKFEDIDGCILTIDSSLATNLNAAKKLLNSILTKLMDVRKFDHKEITSDKFQFTFNNHRFFIIFFAPFYPQDHSRHTFGVNKIILFFHSEKSFLRKNLVYNHTCEQKKTIRNDFKKNNAPYDHFTSFKKKVEAYKYLKPINSNELIEWWNE